MKCFFHTWITALFILQCVSHSLGGETPAPTTSPSGAAADRDPSKHFKQFSARMNGAVLVGHFTTDAPKKKPPEEERYEIRRVIKMEQGDYWMFESRIRYGQHDVTVPLALQVKWAGNTPVITLDRVAVPGLGTFDARVVISGDRYAGTWCHDRSCES